MKIFNYISWFQFLSYKLIKNHIVHFSRLTITTFPNQEHYEWSLRGQCLKHTVEEKPSLLCNKLSLDWPGVAIGQSKQQKLILRNNSNAQTIQLSLSILGDHSNFQIQNDYLLQQRGVNKYEASIKAHGELPVHILFIPSSFSMISSSLVLRTLSGSTKFVIPLSGYGGCSNLDLNGVRKLNEQLWVDLGDVYIGKKNVVHLTIRNSGSRAGFVVIKCFSGTYKLFFLNVSG